MSRQIDWSKPLSDADRAWAEQFALNHPLIAANDAEFGSADDGSLAGQDLGTGDGDDSNPETVKPYGEWTKDELVAEVGNREIEFNAKKVTKADLVALLEANDAEAAQA